MNYIMYFDIAALFVIGTVIIHYSIKKNIRTFQTQVFMGLVVFGFVSALLNLFIVYAYDWVLSMPLYFNYFFNMLYLGFFNALTPMYFFYICLVVKKRSEFTVLWKYIVFAPVIVDFCLIYTTEFTKLVFYIDENGVYRHGPGMAVVYLIACYYLVACIVFVLCNRNDFQITQRIAVCFFTCALFVAILLQMFVFTNIMISEFAAALSVLMVYLSLENPDDYADKRLGAYNRNALVKVVSSYIESGKKFEVLGIQIGGFKHINDTIGVNNGNALMKQVVVFLLGVAGKDRLFRISGTRFAIIPSDYRSGFCESTVKAINERFAKPFLVQELEISLSALMCNICCPENVQSLEDVLTTLECSFVEFEQSNDNGLMMVSDSILEGKRREHTLLQIMRHALHNGEFEMYYQPIYSVEQQRFTCAEALLRLNNDTLGYVSPEEFIPLAEKNGLILEIGEFVFRDVCRFIAEQNIQALGIEYVEINLSVVQCMQEKLHETLLGIVDEYGVPYDCIDLEITETSAVVSSETLGYNMKALSAKGITFALDDYGTGYSTTSSLISYPFHIIKLDKSMVWSAFEEPKALCALKYTIEMIKHMDMSIVAEGVETLAQAEALSLLGCDYFQGYYYSRPVPAKRFLELLADKNIKQPVSLNAR